MERHSVSLYTGFITYKNGPVFWFICRTVVNAARMCKVHQIFTKQHRPI